MCVHTCAIARMRICTFGNIPQVLKLAALGLLPPYIGKLPTPMLLPFGFQNVNGVSGPQPLISKQ